MNFQRGMWDEAWVQSINARKFVALAVFGDLALRLSMEWFEFQGSVASEVVGAFASTFLWAYLAYAVHAQVLLPLDRGTAMTSARVFGFALRTFGIGLAMAIAVVGIMLVVALMTFLFVRTQPHRAVEVIVFLVGAAVVFTVFVRLGTLLPAYVVGRLGGVDAAIKRGKMQFRWIAGRLLVGPCLLLILSVVLYSQLAVEDDEKSFFWDEERVFLPVVVFGYLVYNTVQAFVTALTAVILSRAFIRAEGMPGTAAA